MLYVTSDIALDTSNLLRSFEVFKSEKIHIVVFWVMTPYFDLVGRYQYFGELYYLHLQC
jgi:hypothetical protein